MNRHACTKTTEGNRAPHAITTLDQPETQGRNAIGLFAIGQIDYLTVRQIPRDNRVTTHEVSPKLKTSFIIIENDNVVNKREKNINTLMPPPNAIPDRRYH
jgi:hypothetical protein